MESSKLDAVVLEELRSVGGSAFLRQVVDAFLDVRRSSLTEMGAALQKHDPHLLETSAHRLKGSCASIGARQAAHLCLELQSCGRAGRIDEAGPKLCALETELTQVIDSLQAIVGAET